MTDRESLEDHVRGVGGNATPPAPFAHYIDPSPDPTLEELMKWTLAVRESSGDPEALILWSPSTQWPGLGWILEATSPRSSKPREILRGSTPQAVALRFEAMAGERWRTARAAKAARS